MKKILPIIVIFIAFVFVATAFSEDRCKEVYITFDDGPTANTPKILDTLDKYNAKATFFVLSDRIKQYPEYMIRMKAEGHSIGLHGTSHDFHKIYSAPSVPLSEMNDANDALFSVLGFRTRLARTPYGSYPNMSKEQYKILCAARFLLWDWTVDPRDSIGESVPVSEIMRNIRRDIKSADVPIVLLHDRKSTASCLDTVLKYFSDAGYSFRAIDESMTPVNFMELYGKRG